MFNVAETLIHMLCMLFTVNEVSIMKMFLLMLTFLVSMVAMARYYKGEYDD